MPLKVKKETNIIKQKEQQPEMCFWAVDEATVYQQLELRNYTKTTTEKLQPTTIRNKKTKQKFLCLINNLWSDS